MLYLLRSKQASDLSEERWAEKLRHCVQMRKAWPSRMETGELTQKAHVLFSFC